MNKEFSTEYKKLGLNIAYYRKEKGFSQLRLGEAVNISRTHMSRIENCDCAVSLDVIFAISKILGIQVNKLFEFRD
jgi:transcriptional regulator with XRE-family HTH domain